MSQKKESGSGSGSGSGTAPTDTPTIFELSRPGRRGIVFPPLDVPAPALDQIIPAALRRKTPPRLPEVGELEVVRHFTRLSRKCMSIDANFYPLGSCTMKYNPKINESVAAMPGFRDIHPYAPEADVQGALEVLWQMQQMLAAISGLPAVTVQPAAGAHGEFTALLVAKAWFASRGESARTQVLVPHSAHGTNPASAALAGLEAIEIASSGEGFCDLDDLRAKVGPKTAVLMITNPSTLGLFDKTFRKVADIVHAAGGLIYMDGANMNAILGIARPGDIGADLMHFNVHKTFSTPHGGGGPGSGPVAVSAALAPFLPAPRVVREKDGRFRLERKGERPQSIGRVKAYLGNAGILVRGYTYLRAHDARGLRAVSENAVLNANYLRARLRDHYHVPFDRACMHEVVLSAVRQKEKGVRALDIAKRLLDFDFHPPTIYFPLIVDEALMIEPTEDETKETLDAFADALIQIARDADERGESSAHDAPTKQSVRRLDEVRAARKPVLRHGGGTTT